MSEKRNAHPYFMHDAIHQQPALIAQVLETERKLIDRAADAAAARKRLVFVGIGTSYHAAQIGEHFLRHLTGGRASALLEQSFELVNYPLALGADDAVIAVSHRGWKNYSVQAIRAARAVGALTISITGRDGGEGIRAADFVLPTCEQETSFAHTKSYATALAVLAAFAIRLAERRNLLGDAAAAQAALGRVPEQIRHALDCETQAREVARQIATCQRWIFVGAGPNWATAREGALKVKETSYIAAEGFETEQFLHGPLAEMDSRAALVALLTGGPGDDRARAILRATGELGVLRVAVAAKGTGDAPTDHRIEVPAVEEWLSPFVQVVPVQLLSYYVALERGCNPDTGREDQPAHARAREHYKL
jgi:glucosamine--fructose-6-phosphate aminotransferase (isomerizing)